MGYYNISELANESEILNGVLLEEAERSRAENKLHIAS